ncbi:protein SUA5 [Paecilomyces variotii No. 5]|uniref:Threonylcarbamoyl-AMP synthase n=1 Tax=Byssochlamys spectabilis (strain No. 5 / NBRC 109023) TaxID=1356009 RepID=V5GE47_BYSSN|nr:protein SUA5 [Paecilomyces variotii No. 5]
MTTKRATQILPVHRLNEEGPGTKSLPEWWADERSRGTPEAAAVAKAAETLRTTDVPVAFPTETVYGLGADATRSDAVQGIYKAKQRPSDNPLIVHVDSMDMLQRILNPSEEKYHDAAASEQSLIPPIYQSLIEKFWPGPLTIILPNPPHSVLAKEVTSNLSTFGVRMPSSPFARLLIHVADRPLAAPSANASTKPSPTAAQHVYHDLNGRIDIILDGGPCGVGVESTVVDGLSNPPAILRPGGVGLEELRQCPGWENVVIGYHDGSLDVKEAPRAPGMKYRHYSPRAKVVLFEPGSNPDSVADRVHKDLQNSAVGAHNIGIVRTRNWGKYLGLNKGYEGSERTREEPETKKTLDLFKMPVEDSCSGSPKTILKEVYDYPLGSDVESIARGLFSALRTLDSIGVEIIYVEGIADDEGDLSAAVMNRLRKAAEAELKA